MANQIEELVVRAKPEGLSEVSGGFNQMQSDLGEAETQMGETTSQLGDMANKWTGLMTTLVGGLAVASAGLLSQVPVVGEAFAGLSSILDAVAYRMDSVLRPVLQPLTDLFYGISEAIFEAEGAWGTLVGVGGTLASILGMLAGAAASVGAVVPNLTALGAVSSVFSTIASVVTGLVSTLAGLVSLPATIIAAIVGFAAAYATNWMGIRDRTNAIIGEIIGFFKNLAGKAGEFLKGIWTGAKKWLGNLGSKGVGFLKDLYNGAVEWLGSLPGKAVEWGKGVFNGFVSALQGLGGAIADTFITGLNRVIEMINTAIDTLPGTVQDTLGLGTLETVSKSDFGLSGSGGGSGSSGGGSEGFTASRNVTVNSYLDGRRVDERQGRHRADRTHRRGI